MSTTISEPVSATAAAKTGPVSRSPGRLAWGRFLADKKTVASAVIVLIYVVLAVLAPFLVALDVLDPFSVNQDLIGSDSLPIGPLGGG
ncbi:MAG: hypothetical protein QM675_10855 [Protaetiibacter sp.]